MTDELIDLDDLTRICGYFDSDSDANNGYGCIHPENIKDNEGECHSYSCPVAVEAEYEDMLELDPKLAEQYQQDYEKHGFIKSDWMRWGNGRTKEKDS